MVHRAPDASSESGVSPNSCQVSPNATWLGSYIRYSSALSDVFRAFWWLFPGVLGYVPAGPVRLVYCETCAL